MGNSELLLKEALMGAEAYGVEVELLRLHDLNIKPCNGCVSCVQGKRGLIFGGPGECAITDDDMGLFNEKLWESDGLIISQPIFIYQPPGYLKVLADRCGPSHDQAFVIEATKISGGKTDADQRVFKPRVGGFISVGGAPYPNWTTLGLPLMHGFTFPMDIKIVDMMQVHAASVAGQVVVNDAVMDRVRLLGRHVAQSMGKPQDQLEWYGDDEGMCPVCHCDAMIVSRTRPVMCATCGIEGELREVDGKVTITFSSEQQALSRLTLAGKRRHFFEIMDVQREFDQVKPEVRKRVRKYRGYSPTWKS